MSIDVWSNIAFSWWTSRGLEFYINGRAKTDNATVTKVSYLSFISDLHNHLDVIL